MPKNYNFKPITSKEVNDAAQKYYDDCGGNPNTTYDESFINSLYEILPEHFTTKDDNRLADFSAGVHLGMMVQKNRDAAQNN